MNNRLKQAFKLSVDIRRACAVLLVSAVLLGGAFVLGMGVGRQAALAGQSAQPADALAHLDEPLAPKEEPAPQLNAHQALTDSRSLEKSMPVAAPARQSAAAQRPEEQAAAEPPTPPGVAPPAPSAPVSPPVVVAPPAAVPSTVTAGPSAEPSPAPRVAAPAPRSPARAATAASQGAQASSKGAFWIQVGSSHNRADADRLAKKVGKAKVVAADVPGKGRWYRVLVGSFDSREAAKRQLASLSRSGVSGIVTAGH